MKIMKWILAGAIALAIVVAIIGAVSIHETDAYLDSVDAFITEVD